MGLLSKIFLTLSLSLSTQKVTGCGESIFYEYLKGNPKKWTKTRGVRKKIEIPISIEVQSDQVINILHFD